MASCNVEFDDVNSQDGSHPDLYDDLLNGKFIDFCYIQNLSNDFDV